MRDLMIHGNAVFEIEDPPDLRRVAEYELYGKRSIRYRLTHAYPDGQTVRNLPAEAVCHVMVNPHRDRPWDGCSPFSNCELHWAVESAYFDQARLASKRYIASPSPETNAQGTDADKDAQRTALVANANAPGTEFVFSQTQRGTDQRIQHVDLTFNPTQPGIEMRRDLIDEVWEAVSYPKILRAEAPPGVAAVNARASWIDGWLQSTMSSVAEQLSMALFCDVMIDTAPCKVPQVGDQAVAIKTLVEAGVPVEEAKVYAGVK